MISNTEIEGRLFSTEELKNLAERKTTTEVFKCWEKDIIHFLKNWFSESSYIEVQTSGSTGKPKTIRLEKSRMETAAGKTLEFLGLKPGSTALLCLPVRYIAGKMMIVRALAGDLRLFVTRPSSHPLDNIDRSFDFAAMTPMQLHNIIGQENGMQKLNAIRNLIIGGAEIHPDLEKRLQLLENKCFHTYGMTETITHVAMRRINGAGRSRFFKAMKNISFETNENNCLVISAPDISDEKIITNDMVHLKGAKQFEFIGRYDHVINSGGIKLFPEVIEGKLRKIIDGRFIITGIPDDELGEKAALVVEGNRHLTAGQVKRIKSKLNEYEIPKAIFYLGKFAETENGKIKRKKVAEEIRDQ